jgi:hypothetical protein
MNDLCPYLHDLYLYHHLGLGDHIICNGLVREWIKDDGATHLFVKHHNLETVAQMYEDTNLQLIGVKDDEEVNNFKIKNNKIRFQSHKMIRSDCIKIGFHDLNQHDAFDQQFYRLAGVPFEKRWTSFKINRHKKKENSLIYGLNLPEKFALLHEDESRGYVIDRNKINLPIVKLRPIQGFTMIDWLGVAELAEEIHVIDSSFMFLLDSVETNVPLYIHRYSRQNPDWQLPTLKKNWIIL